MRPVSRSATIAVPSGRTTRPVGTFRSVATTFGSPACWPEPGSAGLPGAGGRAGGRGRRGGVGRRPDLRRRPFGQRLPGPPGLVAVAAAGGQHAGERDGGEHLRGPARRSAPHAIHSTCARGAVAGGEPGRGRPVARG